MNIDFSIEASCFVKDEHNEVIENIAVFHPSSLSLFCSVDKTKRSLLFFNNQVDVLNQLSITKNLRCRFVFALQVVEQHLMKFLIGECKGGDNLCTLSFIVPLTQSCVEAKIEWKEQEIGIATHKLGSIQFEISFEQWRQWAESTLKQLERLVSTKWLQTHPRYRWILDVINE